MVEVDRVPEVDLFELVEDGAGVVQRAVQVDPLDTGVKASTVTPVNGRSVAASLRHPLDSFGHRAAVPLRGRVIEEVRAHVGVLRAGESERDGVERGLGRDEKRGGQFNLG